MKNSGLWLILFLLSGGTTHSQPTGIDTIKSYINITISSGPGGFFLNGQKIPKFRYDYYKKILDQTGNCTPCWVKNYEIGDWLASEGLYYTDCPAGLFIGYHENGEVKETGYYKQNSSGNWKDWYSKGGCRKEGAWKIYNESGVLVKTEVYENGVLKE